MLHHNVIREPIGLINCLLHEGREVRIKNDYSDMHTDIISDGEVVMRLERFMLYPGYLNLTKAGTPARVCCLQDNGGFGREDVRDVEVWTCQMNHTYNDHDRENWYDPNEGGEDCHLDANIEKEFII